MKLALSLLALSLLATGAMAQQIADRTTLMGLLTSSTTDDFESYTIGSGAADNMNTAVLNSSTIVNGQGPGLVNPGATYSDPSGVRLQWNGDTYFGMDTKTILSNGTTGDIRIDYSVSVQAVGVDTKGFNGFGWSGFMDVYNGATLVDSIGLTVVGGGTETAFAGYRNDGGITAVVLRSSNYSWSPIIDNSTYGTTDAVPEPFTMAGLAGGLALALRRRRR